jgi:hypothetical protein
MRQLRRVAATCAVGVLAAGLAACGGSSRSSSSSLTKEQYTKKLGRLCLVSDDALRELHMDIDVGQWAADGGQVLEINRRFLRGLDALTPPEEIADTAARYRKRIVEAGDATKDAVAAAKAGDDKALRSALGRSNKAYQASWRPAKEMGAAGCYFQ